MDAVATGGIVVAGLGGGALAVVSAPVSPAIVGVGAAATALVVGAKTGVVVPAAYAALSAVYLQAVLAGVAVTEIPPGSRIARDALLLLLAVGMFARRREPHWVLPHVMGLAVVTAVSILVRGLSTDTLGLLRYLCVVPLVALLVAERLRVAAPVNAVHLVARTLVGVASVSAVVGLLQVAGFLSTGYFARYVEGGRSIGILGQPNNQAFLLVLALATLRNSGVFQKTSVGLLSLLFTAATFATYSRTGIVALILVWLLPAAYRRRSRIRRLRRSPLALVLIVWLLPLAFAARGDIREGIAEDARRSIFAETLSDLGPEGLAIGKPQLKAAPTTPQEPYVTDNAVLDLLIVGGLPLVVGWGWILVRLWRSGRAMERSLMVVFGVYCLTTSAFVLFPGVLFMWTLLFLRPASAEDRSQGAHHSSRQFVSSQ